MSDDTLTPEEKKLFRKIDGVLPLKKQEDKPKARFNSSMITKEFLIFQEALKRGDMRTVQAILEAKAKREESK